MPPQSTGTAGPAAGKTPHLMAWTVGSIAVTALVGVGIYYLSSSGPLAGQKALTKPLFQEQSMTEPTVSLSRIRETQVAIRQAEDEISRLRSEADAAEALQRASAAYQEALELEARGAEILQAGSGQINRQEFQQAQSSLEDALNLFSQAQQGFDRARKIALDQKAEEEKLRAEQKRLETVRIERKKLETERRRLAKERADLERRQAVQAEKERLAKTSTSRKTRLPVKEQRNQPDIEMVGEILAQFKTAYETRDLQGLRLTTQMSERRDRFLTQIFLDYTQIKVSILGLSLTPGSASAIVSIEHLVNQKGDRVTPGKAWRQAKIIIRKKGDRWGKITW